MAPTSRIILCRHAQAEHNVDLDYSIPDAPLTRLGKRQVASLARQIPELQDQIDLIVSSPLQRTLQTTKIGWMPAISKLGGIKKVVCLPQAQECNDFPCDTGSSRATLEAHPEFSDFDLSMLTPEWTSKQGFWAPDSQAIANRACWVRQFLRDQPHHTILLVAHGDILRAITAGAHGPSTYMWKNAEVRVFQFAPASVESDDCFLEFVEPVAAAGGYAPTSTDIDIEASL